MNPMVFDLSLRAPTKTGLGLAVLLLAAAAVSAVIGLLSSKERALRTAAAVMSLCAAVAALGLCLLPPEGLAQPEPTPTPVVPVGDPLDPVHTLIDALGRGDYAGAEALLGAKLLPAEGAESEPGQLLCGALRDSLAVDVVGSSAAEGLETRVTVSVHALDLNALQAALEQTTDASLREQWETVPRSVLTDGGEAYRPELLRETWEQALPAALERGDCLQTAETELRLRYEPGSGWGLSDPGALPSLLSGEVSDESVDAWTARVLAEAGERLVYARPVYKIAEDAPAGPAFDAANYIHTDDPAVVQEIVDSAAVLLDGQELCWNPGIERMAGSEMVCYCDKTILVICWKEIVNNCCLSFCEVKIADGSQLRRALAGGSYSYGIGPRIVETEFARSVNAIASIDGDFYDYRELGITVYQRQLYRNNPALVDSCFFTASGDMLFAHRGELAGEGEAQQFIEDNDVVFGIAFGPILVENGEATHTDSYPQGEVLGHFSRAAIGQLGPCHYLLMTCGFGDWYANIPDINQTALYIQAKGVDKAYTLDGGQTAEIYVDGRAYNHIDFDTERPMSDIIYFVTALPES